MMAALAWAYQSPLKIARAHAGTIDIESSIGKGSSFIVRLPLVLEK